MLSHHSNSVVKSNPLFSKWPVTSFSFWHILQSPISLVSPPPWLRRADPLVPRSPGEQTTKMRKGNQPFSWMPAGWSQYVRNSTDTISNPRTISEVGMFISILYINPRSEVKWLAKATQSRSGRPRISSQIFLSSKPGFFLHHMPIRKYTSPMYFMWELERVTGTWNHLHFHWAQNAAQHPSLRRPEGAQRWARASFNPYMFLLCSQNFDGFKENRIHCQYFLNCEVSHTFFWISDFSWKVRPICQHVLMYMPARQKPTRFPLVHAFETHTSTCQAFVFYILAGI